MKKRFLALLVCVAMLFGTMPSGAFAQDGIADISLAKNGAMTGTGSPDDPYIISDATDLKEFAGIVNAGDTDACATLVSDIVISIHEQWTPIGNSANSYSGTFDGNGKTISGIRSTAGGMFGNITNGTVRNVTLTDCRFTNSGGSIVDSVNGDNNLISGCISEAYIEGNGNVGGILGSVGQGSDIVVKNCISRGEVRSENGSAGGIAGYADKESSLTISGCVNEGTVQGKSYAGGIFGRGYWFGHWNIINCKNVGSVSGSASDSVTGGIAGENYYGGNNVENCINTGNVKGAFVGGILGRNYGSNSEITNCINEGSVMVQDNLKVAAAGGIAGSLKESGNITGCSNRANISVGDGEQASESEGDKAMNVGGIVGFHEHTSGGSITGCSNSGDINGGDYARIGGIAGYGDGITVSECCNSGKISNTSGNSGAYIAGIMAFSQEATVEKCYNIGEITGTGLGSFIGGLVGYAISYTYTGYKTVPTYIRSSYNSGEVTSYGDTKDITSDDSSSAYPRVGGIAGHVDTASRLINCYNNGDTARGVGDDKIHNSFALAGWDSSNPECITDCYWFSKNAMSGSSTHAYDHSDYNIISDAGSGGLLAKLRAGEYADAWAPNLGYVQNRIQPILSWQNSSSPEPMTLDIDTGGYTPGTWTKDDVTVTVSSSNMIITEGYLYSSDDGSSWNSMSMAGVNARLVISDQTAASGTSYLFCANSKYGSVKSDPIVVKIDKTSPTIKVTGNADSYVEDQVDIEATAGPSGIAKVEVNGTDTTSTYEEGYTVTENGTYTFTVTNGAGAKATDTITYGNIGKARPVVEIDSGGYKGGEWTDSDVTLSAADKEAETSATSTLKYKVDNGLWQDYTGEITFSQNTGEDGAVYTFKAISNKGVESDEVSITVRIDKTEPQIAASGDTDSYLQSDVIDLDITTGALGIAKVEVNGEDITSTYESGYTVTENGEYVFTVTDGTGKQDTAAITYDKIDRVKPQVKINSGGYEEGTWSSSDLTLTLENKMPNLGSTTYKYKVDSGQWQDCSKSVTISANTDADGAVYTFKAISASGVESDEVSITVKVDKTEPQIVASGDTDSYLQSDVIHLDITAGLSGTAKVEVNGEDITSTYTEGYTVTENGTYTFTVTNGAGAKATYTIEYKNIDNEKPVISIGSGSYKDGAWTNKDVVLTPENTTANLGTTTYRYKVDGGQWQEYTGPVVVSENTDADGAVYTFKAISASGVESDEASINVKIDKTLPEGDIKIQEDSVKKFINNITFGLFFKENIDVTIISEDNLSGIKSVEYYRSSGVLTEEQVAAIDEWSEYNSAISETASDAEKFVYYVRITDIAGNVTCFGSNGVVFDLTAPEISGITENEIYYTTQKIKVTDANPDSVTVNGQQVDAETLLAGNMDTQYTVAATDKAGNQTVVTISMRPTESLAEAIEGITLDNVTSAEKDVIETYIADLDNELANEYITKEEKNIVQKLKEDAEALADRIKKALQAADTDDIKQAEGITDDTVIPADKKTLEAAKEDLIKALTDYAGNYTEEETARIEQLSEQIDDALRILQRVEEVEEAIDILPDSVSPDNLEMEEKILAAKAQYDQLTRYEKSIVADEIKEKLDSLLFQLYDYRIIQGAGSTWIQGSDEGLSFVANGAYTKFTGILIDEKEVAADNYTAASGSTLITLMPEYMESLASGEHTLTVSYTDGQTSCKLYVKEKGETITSDTNASDTGSPKTGDSSNWILWTVLLLIAGTVIISAVVLRRKGKNSQ